MYLSKRWLILAAVVTALALASFAGGNAHALKLEVAPDAPQWKHIGAAILLYAHIGGGIIGLATGALAILSEKGGLVHRTAGKIFLPAMFVTYLIGAGVAPFLPEGQRPNFVAGILALYLLITGWQTVKRSEIVAGRGEYIGLVIALAITAIGYTFMQMGAASPSGTVDGSPPQAFFIFMFAGAAAAFGELNVILRKTISDTARIARHLWRMCVSLFFASGSLFLGQPQVFPDWFNATPAPFVLALAPLVAMIIWLVIVRIFWARKA